MVIEHRMFGSFDDLTSATDNFGTIKVNPLTLTDIELASVCSHTDREAQCRAEEIRRRIARGGHSQSFLPALAGGVF